MYFISLGELNRIFPTANYSGSSNAFSKRAVDKFIIVVGCRISRRHVCDSGKMFGSFLHNREVRIVIAFDGNGTFILKEKHEADLFDALVHSGRVDNSSLLLNIIRESEPKRRIQITRLLQC